MKRKVMGVPAFLIGEDMVVGLDTEKIEALLDFTIQSCPGCRIRMRVPKNKGALMVTCPKCRHKMKIST